MFLQFENLIINIDSLHTNILLPTIVTKYFNIDWSYFFLRPLTYLDVLHSNLTENKLKNDLATGLVWNNNNVFWYNNNKLDKAAYARSGHPTGDQDNYSCSPLVELGISNFVLFLVDIMTH